MTGLVARFGILFENRTLRQTVAKNAFWLVAGQALSRVLKFTVTAYAARLLGVECIGALAFATALTTLSFTFSDVGVSTLLVREYQHAPDRARLLRTLLAAKLAFVAASAVVALLVFEIFGGQVSYVLLLLVLGVTVSDVTRDFLTAIARAREKAQYETVILGVEGLATLAFCLAALFAYGTVPTLAAGYLAASVTTLAVAAALFRREFRGAGDGRQVALGTLIRDIWPFAAAAGIAVAFTQADTALLGWLRGAHDAGLYGAGSRIMQILLTMPALLGATLLPALSRFRDEPARQATVVRDAVSGVLLFAVPVAFGGIVLSAQVLVLVYGEAFGAGGTAFALLLGSFLAFALTTVLDFLLLSRNLQAKNFTYTGMAAVLGIGLNLILIPRFGPAGAGAAALAAQLLNLALTMRLARSVLGRSPVPLANTWRVIAAGAVMALAVGWLGMPTAPRIVFGGAVYLIAVLALRTPFVYETIGRMKRA